MTSRLFRLMKCSFLGVILFLIIGDLISFSSSIVKLDFYTESVKPGYNYRTVDRLTLPPFKQVNNASLYLYSAIWRTINLDNTTSNTSKLVITAWESRPLKDHVHKCCFQLYSGDIVTGPTVEKRHWQYLSVKGLKAKQLMCSTERNPETIKAVTIAIENTTCITNISQYIQPTILKDRNKTLHEIAACTKLAYGSLNAERLIEWFEAHRLLGVNKVLAYIYKLNAQTLKVFKYYESIGMAEMYPFDIPISDVKRDVGMKNMQAWNDEQIVAFDCQERLQNYKYVALVDTDEYVLPNTVDFKNAWITYLAKKTRDARNLGGIMFHVKVHAIDWLPTNIDNPLFIGQYANATAPLYDRIKGIYVPSRVHLGSVFTHGFNVQKGYKKLMPRDAFIHHYRSCRKEWVQPNSSKVTNITSPKIAVTLLQQNSTKCYDFRQYRENIVEKLARAIKDNVFHVKCSLGFFANRTTQ